MINTKLILIEGLPGAGKSTTAEYLATYLQQHKITCRWFHELDENNPVTDLPVGMDDYPHNMLAEWSRLTKQSLYDPTVTILESRLWQNSAMFMYMSTYTAQEVVRFNEQVAQTLRPLSPALIYLVQDNTATALQRLYTFRGDEWMEWAIQQTAQEEWFQSRGLANFDGWVQFFEEWLQIVEQLYSDWPYKKIKIRNPHDNWPSAYDQMRTFLET